MKAMLEACLERWRPEQHPARNQRRPELRVTATESEMSQEEVEAVVNHQEVCNEEAAVETISTTSSCRAPSTAEEKDPG